MKTRVLIVLDGTWCEKDGELAWEGLGHLRTSEVGEVVERLVRRMERYLRRSDLAASAVSGQAPPAGPQWVSRLAALEPQALAYDKPRCASLDGFTLHAATRAGALDSAGREALRLSTPTLLAALPGSRIKQPSNNWMNLTKPAPAR